MTYLDPADTAVTAARAAIRTGDVPALSALLTANPELAAARIGTTESFHTLLHVVTDWPGHVPDGPQSVRALLTAGADASAAAGGNHSETPLHYAASSDDVAVIDALLDGGADIEAPGSPIMNGPPLTDAVVFGQFAAARRLVERGATTQVFDAAALGLLDRLRDLLPPDGSHTQQDIDDAFWAACHGGQQDTAEYLLSLGAQINALPGWEQKTPLDAAADDGHHTLLPWLQARGAVTSKLPEAQPKQ